MEVKMYAVGGMMVRGNADDTGFISVEYTETKPFEGIAPEKGIRVRIEGMESDGNFASVELNEMQAVVLAKTILNMLHPK